jgi:hypothetical protein
VDLHEVVQLTAESLDRALVIFDVDLRVLTFSEHDETVDRGRLAVILGRKATPQAAEMIAASKVRSSEAPVLLVAHDDVPARVVMPLRYKNLLYGFLTFSEPGAASINDLSKEFARALDFAAARIAPLVAVRSIADEDEVDLRQSVMTDLLSASPKARARGAESIAALRLLPSSSDYRVLVLQGRSRSKADPALIALEIEEATRAIIRATPFQSFGVTAVDTGIVVLAGTVNHKKVSAALTGMTTGDTVGGLGGAKSSLAELASSHREATISLESLRRDRARSEHLADWEHLGLDRLLLQLPLDQITMADLPTGVTRILEAQSGIDLAQTLNAYLDFGGDAQATAKHLHIHRSTFYYRLDKIREVTDLNLADGEIRRDLHTGLRIAHLAGLW